MADKNKKINTSAKSAAKTDAVKKNTQKDVKTEYDHIKLEKKWQKEWARTKIYKTKENEGKNKNKPKAYILDMFPYPSGSGLHVGHPRGYIATDVYARYKTMNGHNVLHPMGWDAFGLPAEEFAIKNKVHPSIAVKKNVARYKEQLSVLGLNYDWSREVNTTDPEYYKWTQWAFLQMHKKGLTYESYEPINWCPSCKTGLANEDLEDGKCERCGSVVEKKPIRQWVIKITDYADRLLEDLTELNWPDSIKESQKNWIGRSEGAEVEFAIKNSSEKVKVFTTRIDTLFGVTYVVLAPESELVPKLAGQIENKNDVDAYIKSIKQKSDIERTSEGKEKTGVPLKGVFAINPANGEEIPVWIADYVLGSYGTGCVMAVPAHDERDFQFAKKYGLPIKPVLAHYFVDEASPFKEGAPIVERETVNVILRDSKNKKVLALDWNELKAHFFVIGGIEDNETPLEAAKRELYEETGYKDVKFVRELGKSRGVFFAAHKNVNRIANGTIFLFELGDGSRDEITQEEKDKHTAVWVDESEIESKLHVSHLHKWLWAQKEQPFIEDGSLINSGEFSKLTSAEARIQIAKRFGKEVVNYKLRDWVFSRQRYWGEPIPLVHCVSCAHNVYREKASLTLSFYEKAVWDAIVSGKKTIETRALNPEEQSTGRYFGDVRVGDVIRLENKFDKKLGKNPKYLYIRIKDTKIYKNILDFFSDSEALKKANHYPTISKSAEEHTLRYATLAPGYEQKINTNGLIAWEFDLLSTIVPVPEKELPLKLPNVKFYEPTGTGESPLAAIKKWVNTKCPVCKAPAKRETNTMPQWAGSCWYYLRYIDPKNKKALVDPKKEKYWQPVNMYVGGAEHATRHLIYARFWHKFLYDIGVVSTKEPFTQLKNQGLIAGPDGRKMSKRFGNVVNPDDVVRLYGADTLRVYEMFIGPFDSGIAWSTDNMIGSRRFIERVWRLADKVGTGAASNNTELESLMHRTIKKVTDDIEAFNMNTAISSLMIFLNALEAEVKIGNQISRDVYEVLLRLLAPFAPHATDELWTSRLKAKKSIHLAEWPVYDPKKLESSTFKIVVQINSRVRATFISDTDIEEAVIEKALVLPEIKERIGGKTPSKTFYVKGKLVNLVVDGM